MLLSACARTGLFVGGGLNDDNREIWGKFVALSSPEGRKPYIGIVKAASTLNDTFEFYSNLLITKYHVSLENLYDVPVDLNHTAKADDATVAEEVKKLTGIFFAGGDQERLEQSFFRGGSKGSPREKTLVFSVIESQYNAGLLVVAG
jgi:cyanophycinase-like exopeptidase